MHDTQPSPKPSPRAPACGRRSLIRWTVGATGAAALTSIPGTRWTNIAAAQDDVILTAAASEVGASPGAAYARSAAAEAAAARGAARVQAAAALAEADSDGAITQSPVAHAVAVPGEGAEAQSAVAVASASSQDDADDARPAVPAKVIAPAGRGGRGGRRAAGGGGGRRARGGGRAMRVGRGGGRRGRGGGRDRVGKLPSSGIGSMEPGPLASLFAVASAAAALGSVILRRQAQPAMAARPAVVED